MNEDLFPGTFSLSPKLEWLKQHGLRTVFDADQLDCPESPETGEVCYPWLCAPKSNMDSWTFDYRLGVGRCEEDAIVDYCMKTGTPHYSLKP
jgi:hypothetical protein